MKRSPLAPEVFPALPAIDGVRLSAAACGIRYKNRNDVLLAELCEGAVAAGVFTRSLTASAPVLMCRAHVKQGKARALIVNSGNSNAFTGHAGEASVARVKYDVCGLLHCLPESFYMASTGVIGEALPDDRISNALPELYAGLSEHGWNDAATAILTTDTFPKQATRKAKIGGKEVTINGIAKGSGMIAPDMATMLAFIFTDAAVPHPELQTMLEAANARSFNCITVDGDTSTSDTCLMFATGRAGNPQGDYADFAHALLGLMTELAQLVVRDGEGASKFIIIDVTGAETSEAARRIGLSIGNSPLVKTAIAGEDANWGRIVMAVGKAGERADRDSLRIEIGGVCVAREGMAAPEYREEQITEHMKGREIRLAVDVGIGKGHARVWTCDFTHSYIDINGSYRS